LQWRLREQRARKRKDDCEKYSHEPQNSGRSSWCATVVLGSARLWCVGDRILRSRTLRPCSNSFRASSQQSSSPQNAAISTLQACAPQNSVKVLRLTKHSCTLSESLRWEAT